MKRFRALVATHLFNVRVKNLTRSNFLQELLKPARYTQDSRSTLGGVSTEMFKWLEKSGRKRMPEKPNLL